MRDCMNRLKKETKTIENGKSYYKRKQQERVARSEKVDGALSGVIKRM
jgi:hypothetical protein